MQLIDKNILEVASGGESFSDSCDGSGSYSGGGPTGGIKGKKFWLPMV